MSHKKFNVKLPGSDTELSTWEYSSPKTAETGISIGSTGTALVSIGEKKGAGKYIQVNKDIANELGFEIVLVDEGNQAKKDDLPPFKEYREKLAKRIEPMFTKFKKAFKGLKALHCEPMFPFTAGGFGNYAKTCYDECIPVAECWLAVMVSPRGFDGGTDDLTPEQKKAVDYISKWFNRRPDCENCDIFWLDEPVRVACESGWYKKVDAGLVKRFPGLFGKK